ncbi:formate dehydrogenase accessory sulfurtransferase FdhD [Acetobacter sp.]|jgi:FdhD protein|uniref:formate dehydrogenase accessory sulfurtransferase FdhD n=1 Tax=Acetobacter sp. TaxID=440 RepID=UPI0025BE1826|nr:formate dehydrogenase accessory sulfurtransferase FdhD [Acetobacter sp.]MCH4092336.1 formate dehydrogenase accessory sulfurtransferase FdhD [Acetobacter sp.]MCI1300988.1 formate dehydrogenase accessory sulfurtransferase FdhD [Acetobacter sp.]MCI1317240.1 formate dehydrogenase accessory sulfurtransferase FdhD [Acetobacter sp.]
MSENTLLPVSHIYSVQQVRWQEGADCDDVIREQKDLVVADEVPLSLIYGGMDYAVMMITPHDVEDFVTGFSLTEGIITSVTELRQIAVSRSINGLKAEIQVGPEAMRKVLSRSRRPIAGRTGCGVCGADEESLMHHSVRTVTGSEPSPASVRRVLENIRAHQVLNKGVGMLHAAAWCREDGHILHIREDVGRHNALDKLIGLSLRREVDLSRGFCVLTSRCSYEMVAKAITAGIGAVVALSSPTAFALRLAREADLVLISSARLNGFKVSSP